MKLLNTVSGSVFITYHFLSNLQMGPVSMFDTGKSF